jgi:hypothetical protein
MNSFKKLFDLGLRLTKTVEISTFYNSDWAILFSNHYLVFSLLQNFTDKHYSKFQDMYGKVNYFEPDLTNLNARGHNSFLSTLVIYVSSLLKRMEMERIIHTKKITSTRKIKFLEGIPMLKHIIDFLSGCLAGDNENDKIVCSLTINYLLNFLLARLKTVGQCEDIINLKYSISKLILEIIKKD